MALLESQKSCCTRLPVSSNIGLRQENLPDKRSDRPHRLTLQHPRFVPPIQTNQPLPRLRATTGKPVRLQPSLFFTVRRVAAPLITVSIVLIFLLPAVAGGRVAVYNGDIDQIRISSVDELERLRIWKSVDPRMTKRKMPSSQGPICVDYSFF